MNINIHHHHNYHDKKVMKFLKQFKKLCMTEFETLKAENEKIQGAVDVMQESINKLLSGNEAAVKALQEENAALRDKLKDKLTPEELDELLKGSEAIIADIQTTAPVIETPPVDVPPVDVPPVDGTSTV